MYVLYIFPEFGGILTYLFIDHRIPTSNYLMASMCGWSMGDIIAISRLAANVYAVYKDAPNDYRHISEEVMSFQIILDTAVQHFESVTFSDNDLQLGQKILKDCQCVLEGLNSLVEKCPSVNTPQALTRVKQDITTFKAGLVSNTSLLGNFVQRFDIPTTTIKYIIMLISLLQLYIA